MEVQKKTLKAIRKDKKSKEDLELIIYMLKSSPFFKNQNIKENQELNEIANSLNYQYVTANESVFRYGDEGDRFYFLLRGKCSVHIPHEMKNCAPEQFIKMDHLMHNPQRG